MKLLMLFLVALFLTSCTPQGNLTTSSPSPLPTERKTSNTELTFTAQGGKEINASVVSSVENGKPMYLAVFKPAVEATDGNIYIVALKMLETFYGNGRGLIVLKDAKIKDYPAGKFLCWPISNPSQNFCLSHIKNSDTDKRIGGAMFFVE